MASITGGVFWISLAGLVILTIRGFRKHRQVKQTVFYLIVLVACGGMYRFLYQSGPQLQSKGVQPHQGVFVVLLYVFMVLGMVSQYLYDRFMKPHRSRQPFDVGNFLAPILASPIVFIPLLAAFQNAEVDLVNLTAPKLMMFLVTFENGFFWKEIFDKRRREQRL